MFAYTKTSIGGLGLSVSIQRSLSSPLGLNHRHDPRRVFLALRGDLLHRFRARAFIDRHSRTSATGPRLLPDACIDDPSQRDCSCLVPTAASGIHWAADDPANGRQVFHPVRSFGALTDCRMIDASVMNLFDDHPEISTMGFALKIMAGAGGRAVGPAIAG